MATNLWTAFIAHNGSNDILAASSPDGMAWTSSGPVNQTSPFTPSLALFEGKLYVAFITDDIDSATGVPSNRIFLCSTADGVSWSNATFFHQYSKCAPSLAVWNGKLHIAFVANDPSNRLLVYYSSTPNKPTSWSASVAVNQTSASAPSLAAWGPSGQTGELYLAFVAENGSNDIFVCSLAVGGTWSSATVTGQSCHFSPALAALGGSLYLLFAAANGSKDLLLCSRNADGSWSGAVPMNQSSSASPSAVGFGPGISAGFVANNPSGEVLLVSNPNPTASWTSGNIDVKQQSAAGPALAVAPLAYDPVSPAPSAANDNYLITNYTLNDPLQNVTVTVVAKRDLVNTETFNSEKYQPVGNPVATGFSFQLNCQPPGTIPQTGPYPGPGQDVWEQYGIAVQGRQFSMWYENSTPEGLGPTSGTNLFLLPNADTIPSGYKIEMKLVTDPSTNNVTALSVKAWDSEGKPIKGGPGTPVEGPWILSVASSYQAPILNLQFNIGGANDGEYATFQSGLVATVSYQADSPLMVRGATNLETAENANISFGLLAAHPPNPIIQRFHTS